MPVRQSFLSLVGFSSADGFLLPGLLYEPVIKTDKAALYLHGNGSASVFYSPDKMNLFARKLNRQGIAFFPFNNRGAHYLHKLNNVIPERETKIGTAFELIRDCVKDIDGAISYLKNQGYRTFYLIGSSTGANKIVVYHKYRPFNEVLKYVLLAGGDDTGLYYKELGANKFHRILDECRMKVAHGQGGRLISTYLGGGMMSYRSLYDTINPDGDYNIFPFNDFLNGLNLSKKKPFGELTAIDKPTILIYGDCDEYCYGRVGECVNALRTATVGRKNFNFKIIKGADHRFTGKENKLIRSITDWLIDC